MPYQVNWLDEPYILHIKLMGEVSDAELSEMFGEYVNLAANAPAWAQVHSLIDVAEVKSLPQMNTLMREMKQALAQVPNRAPSTIFGLNRLTRYMMELMLRFTPVHMRPFDTREKALEFLYEMVENERQTTPAPVQE